MSISANHIDLNKKLSVNILSNRSTARLLFNMTQKVQSNKIIFDFGNIVFASKSFLDELNALIKEHDTKIYLKENMSDEVQKMDQFVQRSQVKEQRDFKKESNKTADIVAI
jgi:hypothetical protein